MQLKSENSVKMERPENKKTPPTLRERFDLIKDYFVNSDEKLLAWFLLFGIVISIVTLVALTALGGWLFTGLWVALMAKAIIPFFITLGQVVASIAAVAIVYVVQNYCTGILAMNWRDWLSSKLINQLFVTDEKDKQTKTYLELIRTDPEMKNISLRIQGDVKEFTELGLSLGSSFIKSTLSLGVFVGALWIVGGSLAFVALGLNIVIPGYLVWVALLVAIVGGIAAYFIGRKLPEVNQKEAQAEAEFIQNLELLNNNAENIALEGTESHHLEAIKNTQESILENTSSKVITQTLLGGFQSFYLQVANLLPLLCSLPLFLAGLIGPEQIGLISMSFLEVSNSLGWFAQSFDDIANFNTKMDRIIEIQQSIDYAKNNSNLKAISIQDKEASSSIIMKNLTLLKPQPSEQNYILRNLNLELKAGEHTLILGSSGLGKSTFFKAIKGIWAYGEGEINRPLGKKLAFFPQLPTVINDTLMGLLANPEPADTYKTKEEYIEALQAVGMDKHIPKLETKQDWSSLSGGEKQKIVFAKILLQKPDWLFLDEASSFLDEDSENELYKLIRTKLINTTIVSIAHRSTVKPHHERIITLGVNKDMYLEIISDKRQDIRLSEFHSSQSELHQYATI